MPSTTSARCSSPAAGPRRRTRGSSTSRRYPQVPHRADGLRAASVQPDGARRRERPRDRRQLVGRRWWTSTPASTRRSSGTPRPASGQRSRRCPLRASTTRRRCCCPTGGCCRRAAGSAAPATRSATSPRTRGLLAAVPVPERRDARPAAHDRLGADDGGYGAAMTIATATPARSQGRAGAARRGHALGQHGAALRAADLHLGATASPPPSRRTPTSRRRASTCSSSSTRTECLRSPVW